MLPHVKPAYYLGSSEVRGDLARPRGCWPQRLLRGPDEREYVLVTVSPPVLGQRWGSARDISDVVLAPRHLGDNLSPPSGDGVSVQIYRLKDSLVGQVVAFGTADVEMIAWGEVYLTKAAAAAAQS